MKRIVLWLCSTASAVVLLFSYHTSTQGTGGGRPSTAAAGVVSSTDPTTPVPSPASTPKAGTSAPVKAKTLVVNGTLVSTRYGDVQVQITVSAGRIAKATTIAYPTGGQSSEINAVAVPILQQETLAAQNAHIDAVSGATYTSEGYRSSLQAALDAAHL